jgi:hypothetical protein
VRNSAAVKDLQTTKMLTYGEGEDALQFAVQDFDGIVNEVISASMQSGKPLSDPEITQLAKTLTYHRNQQAIEKAWLAHVKANADAAFNKQVRNVVPGQQVINPQTGQVNGKTALATEGRLVSHEELFGRG